MSSMGRGRNEVRSPRRHTAVFSSGRLRSIKFLLLPLLLLLPRLCVIQEAEKRMQGNKKKVQGDNLPKIQANVANFLGAEALLDFLCILCALCYAWDLASSITFA